MKLKNKKTGEIKEVQPITIGGFRSLAELNEEWEDYEEPKLKKYYWISPLEGCVACDEDTNDAVDKLNKEIGNYFETKEEAERVVEKLKAWKRLRNKGFRFNNFIGDAIYYVISDEEIEKDVIRDDLDLLFGGEE